VSKKTRNTRDARRHELYCRNLPKNGKKSQRHRYNKY
jgi:hypothetical protein